MAKEYLFEPLIPLDIYRYAAAKDCAYIIYSALGKCNPPYIVFFTDCGYLFDSVKSNIKD
jgi:hypothetical protein